MKHHNPKVELMKIKMKAQGDAGIPLAQRLYLRLLPSVDELKPNVSWPLFVDKRWPLGRVLDEMAKISQMINSNQQLDETSPQRLLLFSFATGKALDQQSSRQMSEETGKFLNDADFVVIERVRNAEVKEDGNICLDVQKYSK